MFDELLCELKRLEQGVTVSVPVETDADGYYDKECPSSECLASFKVHSEDWAELVSEEVVYCPICRYEANNQQWFTTAQVENAQAIGTEKLLGRVDQAMTRGVRSANRRAPQSGFITLSFDSKPGSRSYTAPLSTTKVLEHASGPGVIATSAIRA